MSDIPPAVVTATTPAPGSVIATPGVPAGPSQSPVNAASSASQANQQATAAGENINAPPAAVVPPTIPPVTSESGTSSEPASLDTARFNPSGNEQIDQITNLLHNSKFDGVETIINEVITTQELSLSSKATLVDKLGSDVAKLVITQLETSVATVKAAGAAEGKRLKDYAFSKLKLKSRTILLVGGI